jgi:hypothetical protein
MQPEVTRHGPTIVVAFPPSQFGILAHPLGANETKPTRAAEILARFPGALGVINGPMFSRCASAPGQAAGETQAHWYAGLQCTVADYLQEDPLTGIDLEGRHVDRGLTFSVMPDASVLVGRGAHPPAGALVSAQTFPGFVHNGQFLAVRDDPEKGDRDIVWRGALGMRRRDGKMLFIGSQAGMVDFRAICRDVAGADDAGYLDGGGSFKWVTRAGRVGAHEDRPVGTWFAVMEPTISRGLERYARTHPVATIAGAVAIAGGVAGLAYYLTRPVHSRRGKRRDPPNHVAR